MAENKIMCFYPVWRMIETLFGLWGNSNKNEWGLMERLEKAHYTYYHVGLRERGSSQFCAWLLELVQEKGVEKTNKFNPTRMKLELTPSNIIMRCYNVNIQYLSCNKSSVSVYFPSTKREREAGDSCKAGDLIAWTRQSPTQHCTMENFEGQGRHSF